MNFFLFTRLNLFIIVVFHNGNFQTHNLLPEKKKKREILGTRLLIVYTLSDTAIHIKVIGRTGEM